MFSVAAGCDIAARKNTRAAVNCRLCPGTREKFAGVTCKANGPGGGLVPAELRVAPPSRKASSRIAGARARAALPRCRLCKPVTSRQNDDLERKNCSLKTSHSRAQNCGGDKTTILVSSRPNKREKGHVPPAGVFPEGRRLLIQAEANVTGP